MDDPSSMVSGLSDVLLILNFLGIIIYLLIFFVVVQMQQSIDRKIKAIPVTVDHLGAQLKSIGLGLSDENKDLKGRETELVMEEAKKISALWKSRKEQLQMGYWEKMEARAEELKKLQEQKEHIEELIKRTKVKYHKREIDEESFREIVKDYQKQLMETNVKVWELEKALG